MLAAGDCWPNLQDRSSEKDRLELFQNDFPMVKLMTKKEERETETEKSYFSVCRESVACR